MNEVMKKAALGINIVNTSPDTLSANLAFDHNGKIELHFADASDLKQDSPLMPKSFENGGAEFSTEYHLWINMFQRFSQQTYYAEE